jgi:hypothetical protein
MSASPDIASLLAQLGGGQQQQQPDPSAGYAPGQSGGSEDQPVQILDQMIQLARQYLDVEPDEEDKATMAKLLATLQQYKAKDQADMQQALGGNASVARVLRKAG